MRIGRKLAVAERLALPVMICLSTGFPSLVRAEVMSEGGEQPQKPAFGLKVLGESGDTSWFIGGGFGAGKWEFEGFWSNDSDAAKELEDAITSRYTSVDVSTNVAEFNLLHYFDGVFKRGPFLGGGLSWRDVKIEGDGFEVGQAWYGANFTGGWGFVFGPRDAFALDLRAGIVPSFWAETGDHSITGDGEEPNLSVFYAAVGLSFYFKQHP